MNSRNRVNETNLVNYSAELSKLNQLDTKDGLLSFPFDHIYACHSQSANRRQPLQLEKEVEVSTHCIVKREKNISGSSTDVSRLSEQLIVSENQNKKLKDLLIYHLDLIQQQNELITKRDKLHQTLKQENETLKAKLFRMGRKTSYNTLPPVPRSPPILPLSKSPPITCTENSNEQGNTQVIISSFPELLPDNGDLFEYNSPEVPKPERYIYSRSSTTIEPPQATVGGEIFEPTKPPIIESSSVIGNKRSYSKNEMKTETRTEPLYTVTTNSGNPVIRRTQRNRKRASTGIGSLSRLPKTPKPSPAPSTSKKSYDVFEMDYNVNKKSKLTNTYGKSRVTQLPKRMEFTGSLCDRLKLIDTTPTGEDPYLIGEAEMREQSPIPKLMLTKSIRGRRFNNEATGERYTSLRPIYNMREETKPTETVTMYGTPKIISVTSEAPFVNSKFTTVVPGPPEIKLERKKTEIVQDPDMDMVKTEPGIDWPLNRQPEAVNTSDYCITENTPDMCPDLPPLGPMDFNDIFSFELGMPYDNLNQFDFNSETLSTLENSNQRAPRSVGSMASVSAAEDGVDTQKCSGKQSRGKKRAFSTTGMGGQPPKRPRESKAPKKKARAKKSPGPSVTTDKPYHTQVGNPDESWYLGLDQALKPEDTENASDFSMSSTVEVPQWREKPYTSIYTLEGTENLDNRVFEKRHQKLEADERRQLRWHVRRLREQRHTERLRQRQRDTLFGASANPASATYTLWPRPQQDAHFIEISETLPVTGFGEPMPEIPPSEFILPWVRTSKALKRAKRSKTLH